jgi:hypothetical protein
MTTSASASPLKASGALEPEFFGAGEESDYAQKYRGAKEAEQKLMNLLEQRNQSRLSPSMLALAGELLDPGRTGSFGEALGRGAKAYAGMQGEEDRQRREGAMAELQLRNMQLENAQGQQFANMAKPFVQGMLGTGAGPTPAAPSALPPQPSVAKAVPGVAGSAPTSVPTPELPASRTEPGQPPTIMIGGRPVNPQVIAAMKMIPSMKGIADSMEYAYEQALKERKFYQEGIKVQPDYIVDTNQLDEQGRPRVTPIVKAGEADVEIRFPELGGKKFWGSKEDLMEVRDARAKGDMSRIQTVINRLQYGAQGSPAAAGKPPAGGAAPAAVAQGAAPDIQSEAAAKLREDKIATTQAENEVKATNDVMNNESSNRETVFTSSRIIKLASEKPQLFGLLKNPTIGGALSNFIKERAATGETNITKEAVENFMRQSKFDTSKQDMADVARMSSDLAKLHFQYRRTLLQGQGQVSDREDAGITKIQGTTSDPAEFLIGMAQLVGRRSQFDVDVANGLRKYRNQFGRNKTLEDYKSDDKSTYGQLLRGYEGWLTKTYDLPPGLTPETKPAAQALTQSAIKAEIERRKQAKKE